MAKRDFLNLTDFSAREIDGLGLGRLEGNAVHQDQIEGTEMLRPSFLLNVVLNEKKEFLKVFAGDYIQAHREGCRFVESVYGTPVSAPADLVIASCGGYPKDINVYQLQKTMDRILGGVPRSGRYPFPGFLATGPSEPLDPPTSVDQTSKETSLVNSHRQIFGPGTTAVSLQPSSPIKGKNWIIIPFPKEPFGSRPGPSIQQKHITFFCLDLQQRKEKFPLLWGNQVQIFDDFQRSFDSR